MLFLSSRPTKMHSSALSELINPELRLKLMHQTITTSLLAQQFSKVSRMAVSLSALALDSAKVLPIRPGVFTKQWSFQSKWIDSSGLVSKYGLLNAATREDMMKSFDKGIADLS